MDFCGVGKMNKQQGQALSEWLLVSTAAIAIIWLAETHFNLLTLLREWGQQVITHYHFIFNYLVLSPGSGQ